MTMHVLLSLNSTVHVFEKKKERERTIQSFPVSTQWEDFNIHNNVQGRQAGGNTVFPLISMYSLRTNSSS